MQVSKPNQHPLSSDQQAALNALEQRINTILSRGTISRSERDELMSRIYADGEVLDQECQLLRRIQDKVWAGELFIED